MPSFEELLELLLVRYKVTFQTSQNSAWVTLERGDVVLAYSGPSITVALRNAFVMTMG